MRKLPTYIAFQLLVTLAVSLPCVALASSINLHEAPNDTSKVTGTVDLSAGIIPIYTPENSQWIKVADPRNGNTGWVKNSELKDSHGNAITFSQHVSEGKGQQSQTIQMNVGTQSLTPAEQRTLEQQQKATAESLIKAQKTMGQAVDALKQTYQQTLELMQNAGFPKVPAAGPAPTPQPPTNQTSESGK